MWLPEYDAEGIRLYCADVYEAPGHVDIDGPFVIVTDPPYGTGGRRRPAKGAGKSLAGSGMRKETWDTARTDWLRAIAWHPGLIAAVVFWPAAGALALLLEAWASGLRKQRQLHWRKPDPMPQPGQLSWSVESAWVLSREGFAMQGGTDWIEKSSIRAGRDVEATWHPYQKPLEVMAWILRKLPPEALVFDPFMGSGTTLVAAKNLGRRAIGIDNDPRCYQLAVDRLAQGRLDLGAL